MQTNFDSVFRPIPTNLVTAHSKIRRYASSTQKPKLRVNIGPFIAKVFFVLNTAVNKCNTDKDGKILT